MVVRLLPKSEIDKRKSEEQRTAIQEGLKVAERVDTLRETLASEEVAYEKYRTDSLKKIQAEIDEKHSEKSQLDNEVDNLRKERAALLVPLDEKWKEVDKAQQICNEWHVELETSQELLDKKNIEVTKRDESSRLKEEKTATDSQLATARLQQAEKIVISSKKEATDILNRAQVVLIEAENTKQSNLRYEKSLLQREEVVKEARKTNARIRKENIAEQIRLADMRRLLEHELSKLKL